tara:strand:+ start:981 stop:2783 length:1803 start_codon:yes stop_codon:yes gene_type:complete
MTSFWTAEDKIPISQTKVSVPAQHGLQYSPGQKCEFHLPAGINFFQPGESYLNLGVKLEKDPTNLPTKLQLDAEIGAHVLIKDIRIYSGGAGRILLEEYQNYNTITALKYDYETNDTMKSKRALTEGATVFSERARNDHGVEHSMQNNNEENPYFKANDSSASYSTAFTNDQYTEVKALLQLNTGIFSNNKIFPIGMTEGLVVEIIFEDARRCFRTLDQTARYRHLATNPFFMSDNATVDTAAPALPNSDPHFPVADNNGSTFVSFWLRRDNAMGWSANVDSFPFAIGEEITFVNASTGVENPSTIRTVTVPTIKRIEYSPGVYNALLVTLNASYRAEFTMDQSLVLCSRSIEKATTSYNPSYLITNAEFILQQVEMPAGYTSKLAGLMKSGGAMNYDFLSGTNYKISQLASERVANLRLPLSQSRAKSVLCIPTDASSSGTKELLEAKDTYITHYDLESSATTRDWNANHSSRTGLVGCIDNMTAYQLFYDGKLNPNRKVFTNKLASKNSIDSQPLIELEKSLQMGGIAPFSFKKFRENFAIGRALSLQNGVYDTRGTDFALQVEYQETTAPAINKLWHCWCMHLRRIVISGNGITLQV